MRLSWIEVRDFRNYREAALEVPPGLTVAVGPNGHGKTNLLEAMDYLCVLESPRVGANLPLVRAGAESAFVRGEVEASGGRSLIEVEIRATGQNRVQVNRSAVRRRRDLRRLARAVFSGPDDLEVVRGNPDDRRRFMDEAVRTLWPGKDGAVSAYERVLRQRNRLLKDWEPRSRPRGSGAELQAELLPRPVEDSGPPGMEAWNEELVVSGAALTRVRSAAMGALRDGAAREFERLSGDRLSVEYRPSVDGEPLEEAFRRRLAERREDEWIRRTSLVGPHRDDLALAVHGLVARGFASHGEAWGAAVCLRLALASAVDRDWGESPLTLLDDPFSALDPERRLRLASSLGGRGQLVLAVPDEAQVPAGAAVWRVKEGTVVPE